MNKLHLVRIPEPTLEFRYGQQLVYPRDGLFLFGPVDGGRPPVNFGVIGTKDGVKRFRRWMASVRSYISPPEGQETDPQHVPFPGFSAAFASGWPEEPRHVIDTIDEAALSNSLHISNRNEAIKICTSSR